MSKMERPTSQQARKQRKWLVKAPLHQRGKMIAAALSKELKGKLKKNSSTLRKGDKVKIMRGDMGGHTGEVTRVDYKHYKIYIQGVTAKKSDGTNVERPIAPSNVMITVLNEEDKQRRNAFTRKAEAK
jgi:large subunit ribosomal protein L24